MTLQFTLKESNLRQRNILEIKIGKCQSREILVNHDSFVLIIEMSFCQIMSLSASNSTYDYANVYGGTGEAYSVSSAGAETNTSRFTSVDSDASKMRNSAMTPEISRKEERFEVRAPPGKLGMVIDTPNNGPPLVHAIRENSVMSTKVRIGDRLISVDGEDATRMDATKVSRMISSRVNNPVRLLVFTRG